MNSPTTFSDPYFTDEELNKFRKCIVLRKTFLLLASRKQPSVYKRKQNRQKNCLQWLRQWIPKCPELRAKWIAAIGRKNWTPAYSRICSDHFLAADFKPNTKHRKVLKYGAVPSVFFLDSRFDEMRSRKMPLIPRHELEEIFVQPGMEMKKENRQILLNLRHEANKISVQPVTEMVEDPLGPVSCLEVSSLSSTDALLVKTDPEMVDSSEAVGFSSTVADHGPINMLSTVTVGRPEEDVRNIRILKGELKQLTLKFNASRKLAKKRKDSSRRLKFKVKMLAADMLALRATNVELLAEQKEMLAVMSKGKQTKQVVEYLAKKRLSGHQRTGLDNVNSSVVILGKLDNDDPSLIDILYDVITQYIFQKMPKEYLSESCKFHNYNCHCTVGKREHFVLNKLHELGIDVNQIRAQIDAAFIMTLENNSAKVAWDGRPIDQTSRRNVSLVRKKKASNGQPVSQLALRIASTRSQFVPFPETRDRVIVEYLPKTPHNLRSVLKPRNSNGTIRRLTEETFEEDA